MNRRMVLPVVLCVLVCLSIPAGAQLIMNPSSTCEQGGVELGPVLAYSEIGYTGKDDGVGDMDVERILTGVNGAWGLNDWFDLYVSLGFIANAEPDFSQGMKGDSGDGFLSGAGIRGVNYEDEYISVMSYAQLSFISEDYGEASETVTDETGPATVSTETSAEIFDVALGAIVKGYVADGVSVYGGLEFIPYTDGKVKSITRTEQNSTVGGSTEVSEDIERDLPVTLRVGANYELDRWSLRGEISLISETGIMIGAGFLF